MNLNQVKQYLEQNEQEQQKQLKQLESQYNSEVKVKQEQDDYFNNYLLSYVPKKIQKNFGLTFNCLTATNRFAVYKPTGEVIIDGELIPNSNVTNILNYILKRPPPNGSKPKPAPIGTQNVLQVLSHTPFPSYIIFNQKLRQKLDHMRTHE